METNAVANVNKKSREPHCAIWKWASATSRPYCHITDLCLHRQGQGLVPVRHLARNRPAGQRSAVVQR